MTSRGSYMLFFCLFVLAVCLISCAGPQEPEPEDYAQSIKDQIQQQTELRAQYIQIKIAYETLKAFSDAQAEEIESLKRQLQEKDAEARALRESVTGYQTISNLLAEEQIAKRQAENRFFQAQQEKVRMEKSLADYRAQYDELMAKLKLVNARKDPTVSSNLTAEKRAHFYEMWALWYNALFE